MHPAAGLRDCFRRPPGPGPATAIHPVPGFPRSVPCAIKWDSRSAAFASGPVGAPIAQLVEQRPFKSWVAGSSPAGRTPDTKKNGPCKRAVLFYAPVYRLSRGNGEPGYVRSQSSAGAASRAGAAASSAACRAGLGTGRRRVVSNFISLCVPSQYGLMADPPQRHRATVSRSRGSGTPSGVTISKSPRTSSGPFG